MNVHLYISSAIHDDEPFLRYDAKVVVEGRGNEYKTRLPQTVVAHYIERLLHGKEVPLLIEEYLEMWFREEQNGGGVGEVYLSEMSLSDYRTMLRRIASNPTDCERVFRDWTAVADDRDVLVCVAESDLSAPFIMGTFPPDEVFARTVIRGGGGGGDGDGDCDCDCGCLSSDEE